MRVGGQDGYGRYGYLDTDSDGKIICHHCGEGYDHLPSHVRYAHGINTAAEYRELHGLKRTQKLVSEHTSRNFAAAYERQRDERLQRLQDSRDPYKANQASVRVHKGHAGWAPAARVSRAESLRARRGRELTEWEKAYLADDIPMAEWCARARRLLRDESLTQQSMARSLGMGDNAVAQRLRRYRV